MDARSPQQQAELYSRNGRTGIVCRKSRYGQAVKHNNFA